MFKVKKAQVVYLDLSLVLDENKIKTGDKVEKGQRLCYIESRASYHSINSPIDSVIEDINFNEGDSIRKEDMLVHIKKKISR